MKKVYDKCCGVDVHKKVIVACFLNGKEKGVENLRDDDTGTAGDGGLADSGRL